MKKLATLLMAVIFAAGVAGLASAQTQTMPKPEDKKMMEKAGHKPAGEKRTTKNANGTVKSTSADSVVVEGKDRGKDAEWTFAVDAKTKVKKGGKDVTTADLKPGDAVHVRYMEHEGKSVAQAITVRAGGTAKK